MNRRALRQVAQVGFCRNLTDFLTLLVRAAVFRAALFMICLIELGISPNQLPKPGCQPDFSHLEPGARYFANVTTIGLLCYSSMNGRSNSHFAILKPPESFQINLNFLFSVGRGRLSLGIWMASEDGESAVELLGEHCASKLVRERQGRE